MNWKSLLVIACGCLPLANTGVMACEAHMMFNPDQLGFFGRTMVRMAGLAPPEPVFELEHPAMARANMNEDSEIVVKYSRPWLSEDVLLEVSGTSNVQLSQRVIPLEESEGTIRIPYQLVGSGYDSITLIVSGTHRGEVVREVRRIYVRAAHAPTEKAIQVSER